MSALAKLVGYKSPQYKEFSTAANTEKMWKYIGVAGGGENKLGDSVGNAEKQAKELQQGITKFDKHNIFRPHEKSP